MLDPFQKNFPNMLWRLAKILSAYGKHPLQINVLLILPLFSVLFDMSAKAQTHDIQILALGNSLIAG